MALPSLIGGLTNKKDFAPSIFCVILSGILICLRIYGMTRRVSRTWVLHGTSSFLVERAITFGLRAAVAKGPASDQSDGLIDYMQTTLALGFLAIVTDLMSLLRCLLVNDTYPSTPADTNPSPAPDICLPPLMSDSKPASEHWVNAWKQREDSVPSPPPISEKVHERKGSPTSSVFDSAATSSWTLVELEDQPRRRFWFRRIHDVASFLGLVALVTGSVGTAMLIAQRRNEQKTRINQAFRTTSTSIALFLTLFVAGMTLWAGRNLRRVNQNAVCWLAALSLLLAIPGSYRLAVMYKTTTAYDSQEPGAFNSSNAKAAFYTLHVLPEFVVAGALCLINVKQMFGTGLHGDPRWRDETPEEKEKREKKEHEEENEKLRKGRC
ncbi:hypothetical protein LshimejAT787_1901310 [Lyophyllum shimeji]|uniref:Transmembrane protein n=1 Tax=Lyophyllum shimeji TaxID=47721 RepID=A0A9P3UTY5_LYOSH|nr:hypothetical protein LshimejAT787_1901310 [Lyophyllum shimeji]